MLIEKQRVFTCLHDETFSILIVHPDLENNDETVKSIAKFIEFWKTVNVHTPYADIRLRDLIRPVIRTSNNKNLRKPIDMSNFAKEIANKAGKVSRV